MQWSLFFSNLSPLLILQTIRSLLDVTGTTPVFLCDYYFDPHSFIVVLFAI